MGAIARVEFTVLGTVAATVDGDPVPPSTRKENTLLALLLIHLNQTVTVDQIAEALWGDDAPAKPATSIRAYVSNIRRSLAGADDDPKTVLVTESGAYRLAVDRSDVDACRFEDTIGEVVTDDTELDAAEQAARLDEALAAVNGEPFADFIYDDFATVEAARLAELVLVARERRCELAVELGDASAWLPSISALAAMHPLRERLRAAHMRALVATGRHSEALRAFADHRTRLVEEMGIEPGPDLRALEQEILALDDVEVTLPEAQNVPAGTPGPEPNADGPGPGPAERRQVTSIAIVRRSGETDSTDPEDVGRAIREARRRWQAIVEAHGATIEEIPDGLLAHVGYPVTRERDAERAIRAALGVVAHDPDSAVGVDSGPVLATPTEDGINFAGDVATNAMRLAFSAPGGSVVAGDTTRQLASDHIRFEVRQGLTTAVGIEIASAPASAHDLVGREEELALAGRVAAEARDGDGRALVVTGEAGMGKTAFVDRLAADFEGRVLRFVGSPFHADTALWPVAVAMEDDADLMVPEALAGWSRLGDEALAEMAADPADRRAMLLDAALDVILDLADTGPTMCVFDDVHAMDASSLELISTLIEAAPTVPLLVVVAIRGGDSMGLAEAGHATTVGLGPLSEAAARTLARKAAGDTLAGGTESAIVDRAAGVPLFVEEMARALANESTGEQPAVPETVHDLLMARLDTVPEARASLHLAAVAGDGFTEDLLATVADDGPTRVTADLAVLCDAGVLVRERRRREARYRFRHALIRETAYEAVPRTRRAELHALIADALLQHDPGIGETEAEVLARHHEAAGDLPDALRAWHRAASRSLAVSALPEAAEAVGRGLALTNQLDETTRADVAETIGDLWLARGVVITQQSGPSSQAAIDVYDHLIDDLGESLNAAQQFRARWGRWYTRSTGWNTGQALADAKEVHRAAVYSGDDALLIEGHHVMWATYVTVGEFELARDHTREARELYDPDVHRWLTYEFGGHDPGVCMHSISGLTNWILDEPDQARVELAEAIRLGAEIGHGYSRLEASFGPVTVAILDGDADLLRSEAEVLDRLDEGGVLPVGATGYIDACRGVADIAEGRTADGLAILEGASGTWADLWAAYCLPFDTELAGALTARDRADDALAHVDSILDLGYRGRWWDSELRRVRGEALALLGEHAAAISELEEAVEMARSQNAVVLERRAEQSLASVKDRNSG